MYLDPVLKKLKAHRWLVDFPRSMAGTVIVRDGVRSFECYCGTPKDMLTALESFLSGVEEGKY